jgi:hypothetical protein
LSDPQTPDEWREAVAAADAMLVLSDCRDFYGIVKGGPAINRDRCIEIIERGRELGYEPDEEVRIAFLHALQHEGHAARRTNVTARMRGLGTVAEEAGDPIVWDTSPQAVARARERERHFNELRAADDAVIDSEH